MCRLEVFTDGRTLVTLLDARKLIFWRIPDGIQSTNYPAESGVAFAGTGLTATRDLSLAAFTKTDNSGAVKKVAVVDLHNGKEL
ncbi:MAG: hypothetical protein WDM76_05400 [Limisphaerales bacterium]